MKRLLLIWILVVTGITRPVPCAWAEVITDGYLAERETELQRASEQAAAARRALEKARTRMRAPGTEPSSPPVLSAAASGFAGLQHDISGLEDLRNRLQAELSSLRAEMSSANPAVPAGAARVEGSPSGVEGDLARRVAGLEQEREALLNQVESELKRLREAQAASREQQTASTRELHAVIRDQFELEMTQLAALKDAVQEELRRMGTSASTDAAGQNTRLQQLESQLEALAGAVPDPQQRQAELESYRATLIRDVEALSGQLRNEWKQEAGLLGKRLDEQGQALAVMNADWSQALQEVDQAAARERHRAATEQKQSIASLREELYAALQDLSVAGGPEAGASVGQRLVEIRRSLEDQLRGWSDQMETRVADWEVSNREDFQALREEWQIYRENLRHQLARWESAQAQDRSAAPGEQVGAAGPPLETLSPAARRLQREKVQLEALKDLLREALDEKERQAAERRGLAEDPGASEADQRIRERLGMTPTAEPHEDMGGPGPVPPEPAPMEEAVEEPPPAPIEFASPPPAELKTTVRESRGDTPPQRPAFSTVPRGGAGTTSQNRGAVDAFLSAAADAARLPETGPVKALSNSGLSEEQLALLRSGWQYKGAWQEGRMQGHGVMTYPDGQVYDGSWEQGMRSGRGVLRHPSGWVYNGEWSNGLMDGGGTLSYPDGWNYTGSFSEGELTGEGRLKHPDGWTFAGSWEEGIMQGEGILSYPDGWMYEGMWVDGHREGQGTLHHPQGWSYSGSWKGDVWDGWGTLRYTDGWTYSGEWKEGRMHGEGTLTSPEGWQYSGQWKEGAMEGDGELRAQTVKTTPNT